MPVFSPSGYTKLIRELFQISFPYGNRKDLEVRTGAAMKFIASGEYQQVVIIN